MASTSGGKKGAARALNALEISIHKKALSCPKQIAQQEDIDAIGAPRDARAAALNFLLETGYMKLMRFEGTNKLAYKAVRVKEAQNMGLLGEDVQMVLARIEEAGNEGIWTKTIQRKTELPQTVVNKCIKTLESQGIIKNIKAVKTPTRKMYMMAYLEPSVGVTGGPWYTDSEFDSAFVSILLDQFYNYIAARSLPEPTSKCARPIFALSDTGHRYPTATDITQWVKRTQLSSVELTRSHVETLLKVLEYDGRIEKLPASAAAMFASALNASKRESAGESKSRKAKKRRRDLDDDSDKDRERKRRKKSKRSPAINSDEESSSDERSAKSRSRSKKDERGRSKNRKDSDSEASDSEGDRNNRREKGRKQESSSDQGSTDDRRSKRKRGRSKSSKRRSTSDSGDSESESDNHHSRTHSRSSKKSKTRSTLSHSRSESPKLVELDAIEAYVYRAVRPQNHTQPASAHLAKGRELGVEDMAWAQAPCVKCPQAEFCKEGGPVNASGCEYFPEWMDPVGFGRVPYVDEDLKMTVVGGDADVNVEMGA